MPWGGKMIEAATFVHQIELLCGRKISKECKTRAEKSISKSLKKRGNNATFGRRQLNEMLLLCNERIISDGFFNFLAGGNATILFKDFESKVHEFHKLAMLQFGSFRFAFNYLHNKNNVLREFGNWSKKTSELIKEFKSRQKPIRDPEQIDESDLHLLGYLISDKIDRKHLKSVREQGQRNFETYLSYDYLDVYVATSMREKWEYVDVHKLCNKVFKNRMLSEINVRYFDPTQSYHDNSIAKGLIEGLMLKRARCTLYMVQETDTMGKDSEMASTLAQGKPVIAYLPKINRKRRQSELRKMPLEFLLQKADLLRKVADPNEIEDFTSNVTEITEIMQNTENNLSKRDSELKKNKKIYSHLIEKVAKYEQEFYDRRANTLMNSHPLRFQIDLNTGVANGVLVTRTPAICAKVIYKVLTNNLKFDILNPEQKPKQSDIKKDNLNYRLIEEITHCAFRVVTKDEMLTNSFWNLYKLGDE
jgi:hypothetical protein